MYCRTAHSRPLNMKLKSPVSAKVVEYQKKIQQAEQKQHEKMNSLTTTVSSPPQQLFNQGMYSHNPFGASPPPANQVKNLKMGR